MSGRFSLTFWDSKWKYFLIWVWDFHTSLYHRYWAVILMFQLILRSYNSVAHLSSYSNFCWVWLGHIILPLARSLAKPHRINLSISLCLLNTDDFAQESPEHSRWCKYMNERKLGRIQHGLFKYLSFHLSNCSRTRFLVAIASELLNLAQ